MRDLGEFILCLFLLIFFVGASCNCIRNNDPCKPNNIERVARRNYENFQEAIGWTGNPWPKETEEERQKWRLAHKREWSCK